MFFYRNSGPLREAESGPLLREGFCEPGTDVALVSYDNTYLALREEFSLTSVDQPKDLLGERAVDLVCRRAGLAPDDGPAAGAGARSAVLEPELIVRASSLGRQRPPHPAGSRPG